MNVSMPIAAVLLDLGLPGRRRQGRADPRPHGEPARAPRGGAGAAGRAPARRSGGGGDSVRARCSSLTSSRARGQSSSPLDDASYRTQIAYLLERSAFYRAKLAEVDTSGGLAEHRAAAADREGRAPGDPHARQSVRHPPVRGAGRDRPDLLDERHHRRAQLHPVDRGRPRQLDRRLGAQLRGLGRAARAADRLHLQRRALRGRGGARRVRPDRPLPHPGRHREHRPPRAGDRTARARSHRH